MNLAIVGTRTFDDYETLKQSLDLFEDVDKIITGDYRKDGKGADTLAVEYAKYMEIPYSIYYPMYNMGKAGYHIRNSQIANECDKIVAFWNGESKGTKSTIDKAKENGKPVYIIYYSE